MLRSAVRVACAEHRAAVDARAQLPRRTWSFASAIRGPTTTVKQLPLASAGSWKVMDLPPPATERRQRCACACRHLHQHSAAQGGLARTCGQDEQRIPARQNGLYGLQLEGPELVIAEVVLEGCLEVLLAQHADKHTTAAVQLLLQSSVPTHSSSPGNHAARQSSESLNSAFAAHKWHCARGWPGSGQLSTQLGSHSRGLTADSRQLCCG